MFGVVVVYVNDVVVYMYVSVSCVLCCVVAFFYCMRCLFVVLRDVRVVFKLFVFVWLLLLVFAFGVGVVGVVLLFCVLEFWCVL